MSNTTHDIHCGDGLAIMPTLGDNSVDLVIASPPYEDARTYGINFNLKGDAWVQWCADRYMECLRVSRGLVAWVVEGKTKNFEYSATPILLMAELKRRGAILRKPPIYNRIGIPGSGGPDWLRNDYEFIICATREKGKLLWSDNTACGHPPKWGPGGEMSSRMKDGSRVNQWGKAGGPRGMGNKNKHGEVETKGRPSHVTTTIQKNAFGVRTDVPIGTRKTGNKGEHEKYRAHTKANGEVVLRENRQMMTRERDGQHDQSQVGYTVPVKANPGNVIKVHVGGGQMGSSIAHENEAPFPESLVEKILLPFCPPSGTVLDCFAGSGTVAAVAKKNGRHSVSIDIRESQCELIRRRLAEVIAA